MSLKHCNKRYLFSLCIKPKGDRIKSFQRKLKCWVRTITLIWYPKISLNMLTDTTEKVCIWRSKPCVKISNLRPICVKFENKEEVMSAWGSQFIVFGQVYCYGGDCDFEVQYYVSPNRVMCVHVSRYPLLLYVPRTVPLTRVSEVLLDRLRSNP